MSIYLSQNNAISFDEELMSPTGCGFSVDQLMELAGQAVAVSVSTAAKSKPKPESASILVICGPGNNGGDGLVAARHLFHFGYNVAVCYPKRPGKPLYKALVRQLEVLGVRFVDDADLQGERCDIIVDAIFGFSFDAKGGIRAPFDTILKYIVESQDKCDVVSVDVPSGWHVEDGDVHKIGIMPTHLVSLTAPKPCSKFFNGVHFLGGRFVPPSLAEKYNLVVPPYPGEDIIQVL